VGLQIELRYADRGITAHHPDLEGPLLIDEDFLEAPVLLTADSRVGFSDYPARLSFAGGLSYGILLGQELFQSSPVDALGSLSFGDYQRLSWLLDSGVSLPLDPTWAAFIHFWLQRDFAIFGEKDDVFVAPQYAAYGFYAGLETSF
jgi:hypothetical protein